MSVTAEAAKEQVDRRVELITESESLVGLLRAVTPGGKLILAGEGGVERFFDLHEVQGVTDARQECPKCHTLVNQTFTDGRCATCEREYAPTLPKPQEQCEDCETVGAFYSPNARKFRCAQCHAKAGTLTGLGVEARVLVHESRLAACRSDDIHSPRHQWTRAKSSYLCRLCYQKVFEKPDAFGK